MRKITLPVLALAALIVTSCAKEKDAYDKNLTKDTWTLSSAKIVKEDIVKNDYTDGTDNTTHTERNTTTIGSGEATIEQYELDTEVGSADFFQRGTQVSSLSLTYKFEQDGNYTSNRTEQLKSTSTESTGNPVTTLTVTAQPTTSSNTGLWSWQNTGDQKSILSFDLGALQVESISKDELVLKLNTSNTEVSKPNSAQTKTETSTTTVSITMTK